MFGHRYFGARYLGARFFGDGGAVSADGAFAGTRYFGPRYFGTRYFSPGPAGVATGPVITSVTALSGTELSVAWTGTATEYRLNGGTATALPDGTSPDTISGLTPNTEYTVQLRDGAGDWSTGVAEYTDNTGTGGGEIPILVTTGRADEADSALGLLPRKTRAAALAVETDSSLALTLTNLGPGMSVGMATESDSALRLALVKRMPAAMSAETDTALQRTLRRALQAALASETDTALPLVPRKSRATGLAVETDAALALLWRSFRVETATETDTALALSFLSSALTLSTFHRYDVPGELLGYAVPGNTYTIEV